MNIGIVGLGLIGGSIAKSLKKRTSDKVFVWDNDKFSTNPAAVAQNDTIANTSKLQPSIPEMGNYWGNADPMGKALANGEITAETAAEQTETWNAGINGNGGL